jgi:hypothetical protein
MPQKEAASPKRRQRPASARSRVSARGAERPENTPPLSGVGNISLPFRLKRGKKDFFAIFFKKKRKSTG